MDQGWLIPVAALLLGGGGIGTFLGLLVQRQGNKSTASATAVASAIDGLTRLTQEQRAELSRKDETISRKDAEIADLKASRVESDKREAEIAELKAQLRAARRAK